MTEELSIKAREARIRRKANRIGDGWRVEKSRVKNLHINNKGLYQLIDDRNCVKEGVDYDATLDEIEYWVDYYAEKYAA